MDKITQQALNLVNTFQVVGPVILYYDHLVTLPDEVKYIWSQPTSIGSLWFFANRYLNFFGNIAIIVLRGREAGEQGCNLFSLVRQLFLFVAQILIIVLSIIRTYALYGRSKKMLTFLIVVCLVALGGTLWVFIGQDGAPLVENQPGCQRYLSRELANRIAIPWWANFALDALVFGLTLHRTWSTPRASHSNDLVHILSRDGAMYFGVMALAYLANITTFYFFPPVARGCLAGTASAIAVSMASRILLNLRRFTDHAADRPLVLMRISQAPPYPKSPRRAHFTHAPEVTMSVASATSEWDGRNDCTEMVLVERDDPSALGGVSGVPLIIPHERRSEETRELSKIA